MSVNEGDAGLRPGYQGKEHLVYEDVRVFSLGQRLNRLRYVCYLFTGMLVLALVFALTAILVQAVPSWVARLMIGFALVLTLAWVIWAIALLVRRLHDLGRPGWWALGMLIPALNVVLGLYLLVGAPEEGVNRYGTPNPPNSVIVSLVGGVLWTFQVVGLLANVALLVVAFSRPQWLVQWQQQYMPPELRQQMRELEQMQRQGR